MLKSQKVYIYMLDVIEYECALLTGNSMGFIFYHPFNKLRVRTVFQ